MLILVITVVLYLRTTALRPPQKITIADAQHPGFALLYIADKKGFFAEEGLAVSYRKFSLGKDALADVIQGKSDLATVFESPVVRKLAEGAKVHIICTLHSSMKNTGLVARTSHGITTASDLAGKKIAVPKGTNAEFFLNLLLKNEGTDTADIEIIDMPADKAVEALENGTVDAAALYNPYIYQAQKQLNRDTTIINSNVYIERSTITGASFINPRNDKVLVKFLTALEKAEAYVKIHKEDAIDITDRWLPQYDRQSIIYTWNFITLRTNLDNKLLSVMDREEQFFYDNGMYHGNMPYIRDAIATRYLQEVNPEEVTLY